MKKQLLGLSGMFMAGMAMAQPNVTAVSPTVGGIGSSVSITGTGFNTTPSLNVVYFGATKGLVTSATASNINVNVPLGANHKMVSVLNASTGLSGYSNSRFNTNFQCGANLSANTFTSPLAFAIGGSSERTINIGDLDGDGKSEMVIANQGGSYVSVFRNISSPGNLTAGSFAARQDFSVSTPYASTLMDMDGDGKLDIITCSYNNNNASILRNVSTVGTVSFAPVVSFPSASGPYGIITGDVDGDGKAEIITGNYGQGGISVLRNLSTVGTMSFATNVDFVGAGQNHMVDIADIDGDGKKDICAASRTGNVVSVYRNTSTSGVINASSLAARVDFATTAGGEGVVASDMDGDGKLDLVISGMTTNIAILRNTATSGTITSASFAVPVAVSIGSSPSYGLSVGDVTGDGKADIFPCGYTTNSSMIQNLSTPGVISLAPSVNFPIAGTFSGGFHTAIGDLDNDGKNDIINAPLTGTDINVYRNKTGLTAVSSLTNILCNGACNGGILLSTPGSTATVVWSNASTSFTQTGLCAGVYSYSVTSGTCVATSSVALNQPAAITVSASASNSLICSGNSATLTGNASGGTGALTYSWSSGSSSLTTVVSPTANATYTLLAADANSCTANASVAVNISPNPTVTVSGGTLACAGSSVTLTASGASSYTWNTGANTSSISVSPTVNTTYTVNGASAAGCAGANSTFTFAVASAALPSVTAVSSTSLLCTGNSATLTASGASTYSWSSGSGSATAVVSPTATASYTVVGTNSVGCSNSAVVTQSVSSCAGISENSVNGNAFNVYPNPATSSVKIALAQNASNSSVEVYNAIGQLVINASLNEMVTELNISKLSIGIYTVVVKQNGSVSGTSKLIKN